MRFPTSLCVSALAAVAFFAPAAQAQVKALNPGEDRLCSTLIFADMSGGGFSAKGAVNINYTAPMWNDKYTAAIDSGKFNGSNQRLGKNWWTSFDTMVPLEIGGAKVMPGAYYLGLHIDEKGGVHLMVIDAKTALTSGWAPFMPQPWKAEVMAPLTLAKDSLKETQKTMLIQFTADEKDATKGTFSIQWGKHELSAPVKFHLAGAKEAPAPKK